MTRLHDGVAPAKSRLVASLAASPAEILEAQRLRYRIFVEELGAQVDASRAARIDADRYDPWCRHLLVRDAASGRVVACTRLLSDALARGAGGFYSEGVFALDLLESLPGRALEVGRTCVDARYRRGAAIAVLWSALAELVQRERFDYLFGCASIPLDDGGGHARAVVKLLRSRYPAPRGQRVRPRRPLPPADGALPAAVRMPPLIKAYVRLGARACGDASWDPDFNCADVFMLLDVGELCPRYARRLLGNRARLQAASAFSTFSRTSADRTWAARPESASYIEPR